MKAKKILICDDHSLFGSGIKEILEIRGYDVTVLTNSEGCIKEIQTNTYDVLLVDLNIDELTGFDIVKLTHANLINTKVFLLTAYYESFLADKCKKMGFNGFLTKETTTEDFIKAIEMEKTAPFFSTLIRKNNRVTVENTVEFSPNSVKLSPQEKKIISLVVKGESSKRIAEILFISKSTVDTHRKNIYRKLEISGIGSLIRFANENNLTD